MSSHGHSKTTTIYRTISEKNVKISRTDSSATKNIKKLPHLRHIGGTESRSSQNPCLVWQPTSGRNITTVEILPEEWGVWAPHRASQPKKPAPGRWAPITSSFENQQGVYMGELKGCWKTKTPHFKGSSSSLLAPSPDLQALAWKAPGLYEKETRLIL